MYTLAKGDHSWYKRLSVKDGFGTLQIDNWEPGFHNGANKPGGKTLQKIEVATQAYLMREDLDKMWTGYTRYAATREMIKHTAEKLVRFRRAREYNAMVRGENREKWDAYMGKHLKGEQDCFKRYVEEWDLFQLHRKEASGGDIS
jgi:predicted GIY-YIG superfamily endonuclease